MIDVITCRGTGEHPNAASNMLFGVTRRLDGNHFNILGDLDYPASVGPAGGGVFGPSEDESIRIGVQNLAGMVRAATNPVGLLGYSLGSLVVTGFREAQARGEYGDCEIAWSACVANPRRAVGDTIDLYSAGFGINGQHGAFAPDVMHLEAANPADAITSCPENSPLRTVADDMSAFSCAMLGSWTQDLATKMLQRRFQPTSWGWWQNPIATFDLYDAAAHGILGYLSGKDHIHTYIDGGYLERLANRINSLPIS